MPKKTREIRSRPPIERMLRIHAKLQNRAYPNCTKLSKELEVKVRTVMRDLEFMRDRLGLPIEWDAVKNGYYYSRPVEHFPSLAMDEAETFALLVAQKAIEQYRGTPFQKPLETAFRRLTGQLDDGVRFSMGSVERLVSFRPFAPDDMDLKLFEVLTTAVRERRVVKFAYRTRGQKSLKEREVKPYHLACIGNHWYLFGHDKTRDQVVTFALVRMQRPRLGKARFTVPKDFDAEKLLSGSFGVFKGDPEADYEVVIEFDPWAADEIRGRHWHASQEFTELPGGAMRVRMRLNNLEEVERWVLGFGTHATVVRPEGLRKRLAEVGKEHVEKYGV